MRTAITENGEFTGKWFDPDKAKIFREDTYHDGSNFISKATGSQWYHENMYLTKSGKYILNSWSNYQGTTETYELISKEEAAEWFVKNEYDNDHIPEELYYLLENMEV